MSDFRYKGLNTASSAAQSIAARYQTNLSSPKQSFMKTHNVHKSVAFSNLTQLSNSQEDTFIPPTQSNDYLNYWKDFRSDVRKKLENANSTTLIVRHEKSISRSRGFSLDKQDMSDKFNNKSRQYDSFVPNLKMSPSKQ